MMAKKKFEKKQEEEVKISSVAYNILDSEILNAEVDEIACENISTPIKDILYIPDVLYLPEPVHVVSSSDFPEGTPIGGDFIREAPVPFEASPNLEKVKFVVQIKEIKADAFAVDEFEDAIKELSKRSKHQIGCELSKVHAALCDLNNAFKHLSDEGKELSRILLERTLIIKP